MQNYSLSHLQELESEAIFILREVIAQFERPVLLFSGGKDSLVCFHLARKAFYPHPIPFPIMHVDTGHNFPETIKFRDKLVKNTGVSLIVASVQKSIDTGRVKEEIGIGSSRNALQTISLLDAIKQHNFDCAIGGARRDEEKARAKERFFSHRDKEGKWNPKNQRPELWNLFNTKKNKGEHFRVFPISNWTEMDVWQYILQEKLEIPSLYFSHERECFVRDGILMAKTDFIQLAENEKTSVKKIRFRTIGDVTCTGAFESNACSIEEIIIEIASSRITERGGRSDDKRSDSAMEDRKKEGYF